MWLDDYDWHDLPEPAEDEWRSGDPLDLCPYDLLANAEPMTVEVLRYVGHGPDSEERLVEIEATPTYPPVSEVLR